MLLFADIFLARLFVKIGLHKVVFEPHHTACRLEQHYAFLRLKSYLFRGVHAFVPLYFLGGAGLEDALCSRIQARLFFHLRDPFVLCDLVHVGSAPPHCLFLGKHGSSLLERAVAARSVDGSSFFGVSRV